ncbi:MAG: alpha/beta fold hydrolase [Pseudomonadota bacterium]
MQLNRPTLYIIPPALALAYLLLVFVPEQAAQTQRTSLTRTPADLDLEYEDFIVSPQDQALTLHGWWMPAASPRASLVFIHGGGSNRDSFFFKSLEFYRALVDAGINVATIDLRNHGESESDGRGIQFGASEYQDVIAALDWVSNREETAQLPLFAMGISMGGASVIQAVHHGARPTGVILLDPLLSTTDVFNRGAWVQSGLPPALFSLSSWSATRFFGFPYGEAQALDRGKHLRLPILLIQDPQDPVTRLTFAQQLTAQNSSVELWLAPTADLTHSALSFKGRWGTHVAAFHLFPDQTLQRILIFIDQVADLEGSKAVIQ